MPLKRLPSFNDFSPVILKHDLRECLAAIRDAGGDDEKVFDRWIKTFFGGKPNKRSRTNIAATLRHTGLSTGSRPLSLSPFGQAVLDAPTALDAAKIFCAEMISKKNGDVLLRAIASLKRRGDRVTKAALKSELKREGIEALSKGTTDHTTLKNWMIEAQILDKECVPNNQLVKRLLGVSAAEMDEWTALPLAQQIFLRELARRHAIELGPFLSTELLDDCVSKYSDLFDDQQFAKQIRDPLAKSGWIEVTGLPSGPHGGKSGRIVGLPKLREIPIDRLVPGFDAAVPPELRALIATPLSEIKSNLRSSDKNRGGLALELLAIRMVMDLGLDPRAFRLRSAKSGHAEVDLVAEGSHLMFSRWTIQCKRYEKSSKTKVGLSDVAKEVGIALFVKAHVVVMVTTTRFTRDAEKYADHISEATPLQFLFVDGNVVDAYLKDGKASLLAHARKNAERVMTQKRNQRLINISDEQ